MADIQKQPSNSDEIDITQVFRWIGNGFRNFGTGILKSLAGLREIFVTNKTYFAIVIISGLTFGLLYQSVISKKFYKSSMILSCDYLNRQIVENTVEKLNLLCEEETREGLAKELKIDSSIAKNIWKFETKSFISDQDIIEVEVLKEQLSNVGLEKKDLVKKVTSKIELENKSAFQISVYIYNPDIIENLDSAIVNYFKNGQYVKRRMEISKANLLAKRSKLVNESKSLDSLKSVLFKNFESMAKQAKQGSNNVILSDKYLTDPLSVFSQDIVFYNEIQAIDWSLFIQPDFEVIDGLTAFKEPESASLPKVLVIAFLVSWVAGYVIIGFYKFDQYLSKLSKKID